MKVVRSRVAPCALALTGLFCASARAEPDADGCKDQFLTRMAGFHLESCDTRDFDAAIFAEGTPKARTVEGRVVKNDYRLDDGSKAPSQLAIMRNYENAMRQAGWTVVSTSPSEGAVTAHKASEGREVWAEVQYNDGNQYILLLAEKAAMVQSVLSAQDMMASIGSQGHVALYINFDTAKASLKPDAQPVLAEVVAMLKANPQLKLSVEGHTDNVGDAKSNRQLSQARAQSVVAALVAQGVAAGRLQAAGFGPDRPVADNTSDAGRQRNRRVELVRL